MSEYPNLYSHIAKDRKTQEEQKKFGFQTSAATKKLAIAHLQETIKRGNLKIWNSRILDQLVGFQYDR